MTQAAPTLFYLAWIKHRYKWKNAKILITSSLNCPGQVCILTLNGLTLKWLRIWTFSILCRGYILSQSLTGQTHSFWPFPVVTQKMLSLSTDMPNSARASATGRSSSGDNPNHQKKLHVIFEVLTAVVVKTEVYSNITPCLLVNNSSLQQYYTMSTGKQVYSNITPCLLVNNSSLQQYYTMSTGKQLKSTAILHYVYW